MLHVVPSSLYRDCMFAVSNLFYKSSSNIRNHADNITNKLLKNDEDIILDNEINNCKNTSLLMLKYAVFISRIILSKYILYFLSN